MKTSNLDMKKRSAICKTDSCPKEKDRDRNSYAETFSIRERKGVQ